MLMLIESIWALMVFSAEINAEVNKTSFFGCKTLVSGAVLGCSCGFVPLK